MMWNLITGLIIPLPKLYFGFFPLKRIRRRELESFQKYNWKITTNTVSYKTFLFTINFKLLLNR